MIILRIAKTTKEARYDRSTTAKQKTRLGKAILVQNGCGSRTKLRVREANMLMMKHMYEYNAMPWSGR